MRLSRGMGSRLSHTCLVIPAPSSEAFDAGCHQPWDTEFNLAKAKFTMVIPGLFPYFWVKEGQFPFPHLSFSPLHVQINDRINEGMCFGSCYQER